MPDLWYEYQADGSLIPLNIEGECDGFGGIISGLSTYLVGEPAGPSVPPAPILSGSLTSRTASSISWIAGDNTGIPRVTSWIVERRSSTDNGVNFGSWAAISGSPFSATTFTASQTGLSTGTPEVVFQYRVRGVNADGEGANSNVLALQYGNTPATVPTAPTGLGRTGLAPSQVQLNWTASSSAGTDSGDYYGVFQTTASTVPLITGIDPAAVSYVWTGLTPGTTYSQINVRRHNASGWSPASNTITFTTPTVTAPSFTMLMGASVPDSGAQTSFLPRNGGQTQWDAIRVYATGDAISEWQQWSPKVIALTSSGTSNNIALHGGATSATALENFLDNFYYPGGVYNNRNGCEIHWANGNEYGTDVTNLANFVDTVRRMSEVINQAGSQAGGRRYPLASMWLDPTHYQENQQPANYLESLMQSAPYLDGIAWSMYPPGRQPNYSNPTFTKPTLTATATGGFLERCFQRTKIAGTGVTTGGAGTYNPYLNGVDRKLKIAIWEIGIGDDPNDQDHRPYYAAHSLAAWCYERCLDPDMQLEMPVALWWDQQKDLTSSPENCLSNEPSSTSPSTAEAWKNWRQYIPAYGGTKPANWPNSPKSTWPTGA